MRRVREGCRVDRTAEWDAEGTNDTYSTANGTYLTINDAHLTHRRMGRSDGANTVRRDVY